MIASIFTAGITWTLTCSIRLWASQTLPLAQTLCFLPSVPCFWYLSLFHCFRSPNAPRIPSWPFRTAIPFAAAQRFNFVPRFLVSHLSARPFFRLGSFIFVLASSSVCTIQLVFPHSVSPQFLSAPCLLSLTFCFFFSFSVVLFNAFFFDWAAPSSSDSRTSGSSPSQLNDFTAHSTPQLATRHHSLQLDFTVRSAPQLATRCHSLQLDFTARSAPQLATRYHSLQLDFTARSAPQLSTRCHSLQLDYIAPRHHSLLYEFTARDHSRRLMAARSE